MTRPRSSLLEIADTLAGDAGLAFAAVKHPRWDTQLLKTADTLAGDAGLGSPLVR